MSDTKSMAGKTVLVTGATNGIGLVTARELAKAGAHVVITSRDPKKGESVAQEIRQSTGAKVDVLVADFASMKQVKALADEVKAKYPKLDVLVNNAGAVYTEREVTADGLERTFETNHLAPFLLTTELLDLLKKSAPARVVNVASDAHKGNTLDLDDLQSERGYKTFTVYGRSKLMNILFTRELARRLDGTGVTANSLHPGVVSTGFGSNGKGLFALGLKLVKPFFITPEKGAETTIFLATSPSVEGRSGGYYAKSREATPTRQAQDDAAAKKLWDASEALLKKLGVRA